MSSSSLPAPFATFRARSAFADYRDYRNQLVNAWLVGGMPAVLDELQTLACRPARPMPALARQLAEALGTALPERQLHPQEWVDVPPMSAEERERLAEGIQYEHAWRTASRLGRLGDLARLEAAYTRGA